MLASRLCLNLLFTLAFLIGGVAPGTPCPFSGFAAAMEDDLSVSGQTCDCRKCSHSSSTCVRHKSTAAMMSSCNCTHGSEQPQMVTSLPNWDGANAVAEESLNGLEPAGFLARTAGARPSGHLFPPPDQPPWHVS